MRLLIVCVVLSLALNVLAATPHIEEVFSVVSQTQQAKIAAANAMHSLVNRAKAPRALAEVGTGAETDPCLPIVQSLGQQLQNDPNCQALAAVFQHSPLGNSSATAESIGMFLDGLCKNPCFFNLLAVFKAYGKCQVDHGMNATAGSFEVFDKALGFFCTKNPTNGKYCMALLLDPTFLNITNGRRASNASICFGLSQFGCCLPPIFDFVDKDEAASVKATIQANCGFGLPPPCPKPGESVKLIKASWRIKGLAFAYFQNNKERMGNAIQKDIATRLGIDRGLVTVSGFREGSVIVDFDVRAATDSATDALAATVSAASKDAATSFPTVAAEAGTAGLDSGSTSIGFDKDTSSSTVQTYTAPGAGSHVQPMFALVAALVAMAVFIRQ